MFLRLEIKLENPPTKNFEDFWSLKTSGEETMFRTQPAILLNGGIAGSIKKQKQKMQV